MRGHTVACTRCGHWHTDAEEALGRRLTCTEVKRYWAKVRDAHKDAHGHRAQITTDTWGNRICFRCKRDL